MAERPIVEGQASPSVEIRGATTGARSVHRAPPTQPRRTTNTRGAYQAGKQELVRRFNRVSGQIGGIAQMVEEERYCPEVLIQLSAAIAALEKIGYILLRDHVHHCVTDGINRGDGDAYLDELMATIRQFTGR
ncbi:MAG: metal-sensitive transcriptional regulator [Candidatus Dormibacteria bacterium]